MPEKQSLWSLLAWQPLSRRQLFIRGFVISLCLMPVSFLIVRATNDSVEPLSAKIWILSAVAVTFLICCGLCLLLWLCCIVIYLLDPESRVPFHLMEWGMTCFWWWVMPFMAFGLFSSCFAIQG